MLCRDDCRTIVARVSPKARAPPKVWAEEGIPEQAMIMVIRLTVMMMMMKMMVI